MPTRTTGFLNITTQRLGLLGSSWGGLFNYNRLFCSGLRFLQVSSYLSLSLSLCVCVCVSRGLATSDHKQCSIVRSIYHLIPLLLLPRCCVLHQALSWGKRRAHWAGEGTPHGVFRLQWHQREPQGTGVRIILHCTNTGSRLTCRDARVCVCVIVRCHWVHAMTSHTPPLYVPPYNLTRSM